MLQWPRKTSFFLLNQGIFAATDLILISTISRVKFQDLHKGWLKINHSHIQCQAVGALLQAGVSLFSLLSGKRLPRTILFFGCPIDVISLLMSKATINLKVEFFFKLQILYGILVPRSLEPCALPYILLCS